MICTESDNMGLIILILLSVLKLGMFKLLLWLFFTICFVHIINNNTVSFQMSFLVSMRQNGSAQWKTNNNFIVIVRLIPNKSEI